MGSLFASLCSCGVKGVAANEEDSRPATSVHHQHTFEAIKPAEKHSAEGRQAFLFVRMAGSSSGGADSSSNPSSASSDTCTDEPEVWHDCTDSQEWFQAGGEAQTLASSAAAEQPTAAPGHLTAEQAACLQALPTRLCALLTKYLQGASTGCKPLVAVMRYMQDTSTSLDQLQQLLQPLLQAEQHLPPHLPIPSAQMAPAEHTEELRRQLRERQQAGTPNSSSTSHGACQAQPQQQQQQRVGHLLNNLRLAHQTLALMDRQEGFKQVAHGPLQLWYCHDAASKSQMIRARVVLEEPLSAISTVTREFDLVPSWNPGMSDMRELASYSSTELLIYLLPWMPWPLPLPEMVNYCFGADLLDLQQGCVLFQMSSADALAGVEVPKRPRTISLHMNPGGFRLVPLPPSPEAPDTPRTEVTVAVNIDAGRFVVPDHIISVVMRVFAPLVHNSVLRVFKRMFHAAAAPQGGKAAAGQAHSGGSVCSSIMLRERLALRPEYAALDEHAARVLAAGAAASAGPAQHLELYSPRPTAAGAVA